ncbi:MAG: preprotein translocase subunit SecE [Eubacteriales bacterium]|jgi:preprotein translocase subunit SecE|nr:preprotein translocase subunit SecE [Candidatus Colimorpha enterica]
MTVAEEKKTETVDTAPKAAKEEKKKDAKSSKPGLGAKIKKFFKDYKSEMKKVVWYGKNQTLKSTGLVIVCLVVVSAVISLLDLGLSNLILWLGSLV